MKSNLAIFLVVGLVMLCIGTTFAQSVGDYRSAANGNWNAAATWQRWNGSLWATASAPPTGGETITVLGGDTVAINVPVSISDTLRNQGVLTSDTNLTVAATGVFQHDQEAGSLPMATWSTGSTLLITGTISTAPSNRNQSFHNVTFDTPQLAANRDMSWDSVTIGGDIRVVNTASFRWHLTGSNAGDTALITIMGDIRVTNGGFSSNGTSSAVEVIVHHYGDIIVTGGNLSVSRGGQGGKGTRWYLHEGNFSMSNATTQNSNAAGAWFVFDKPGTQTLTLGSGNTLTALPVVIESGTTLDMGVSKLRGTGRFQLKAGAALAVAEPGGLDSAVVVSGTRSLDTLATYIFNGTVNQVTGTTLPDTLYSIVNANPDTLILSQATAIFGPLILKAGVFDNTIAFDLRGTGWIRFEGGNLRFGVPVSVEEDGMTIPESFFVDQNFPNPFNPTTTIVYGLPSDGYVTARVYNMLGQEVANLFDGRQIAGTHRLTFDASRLPTGAYIYSVKSGGLEISKQMVLVK